MSFITCILHNGTANRQGVLLSCIRLARKSGRTVNFVWTYTPVRSCLAYEGEYTTFYDLYKKMDGVNHLPEDQVHTLHHDHTYDYQYWLKKDMVIDISKEGNIITNYGLYTIISQDDDQSSMFKDLFNYISKPGEIVFDKIGIELGDIYREFQPVDELQSEIDKYEKMFFPNMVGIHIRNSDGNFTHTKWDPIVKKLLTKLQKWCSESDNGIFLATDDPNVYVEFAQKLGNKLIFYDPPKTLCNTTCETKFKNNKYNVLCAVVELSLLGKCNKYVIGTVDSTFSFCGMLLSGDKTKKYLINSAESVPEFA